MKTFLFKVSMIFVAGFLLSGNEPAGDVWVNPVDNMKFVWVPPGKIVVDEPYDIGDSTAYRKKEVIFPEGFWLGETEVTVRQFSRFVKETGYLTDAEKEGHTFTWRNPGIKQSGNHPVIYISFSDVAAYTEWAEVEIPYETEWLYACSAGTETKFYWGDEFDYDMIWCRENSITGTKPVAKKPANPYGLYDMVGNVWEYIMVCDTIIALRGASWTRCNTAKGWWGPTYTDVIAGAVKPTLLKCIQTPFQPNNRDDDRGFRCIKRID
jgi:formylglycine-generating enzyme required for sulfatase activity